MCSLVDVGSVVAGVELSGKLTVLAGGEGRKSGTTGGGYDAEGRGSRADGHRSGQVAVVAVGDYLRTRIGPDGSRSEVDVVRLLRQRRTG